MAAQTYTKGRRGYYVLEGRDAAVYALPGEAFLGNVKRVSDNSDPLPWAAYPADGRAPGRARTRIKAVELLVDRHHGRGD